MWHYVVASPKYNLYMLMRTNMGSGIFSISEGGGCEVVGCGGTSPEEGMCPSPEKNRVPKIIIFGAF